MDCCPWSVRMICPQTPLITSRDRLDQFFAPSLAMSCLDLQKVLVKLLEVDFGDERTRVLAGLWPV